ncbi:alanine racemase [Thermovibrio ammonificans]|jgi:alanine racemase|uniref:Alanine racemase n=1 Tax=Thermovibrio ammonificans (strain DSM 15698 / JCM 12110 / HB-1) TaxID=648996 RepID=E8T4G9_THEA1|nr:alanine racemase [Thermovibrio ammonificans]ADU96304.1 alanine racemase [Thermovibrio ammonificans HB-1]
MLRWAEVHLDRLLYNYRQVEKLSGPKKLIAVVKANAYGHGSVAVARFLQEQTAVSAFAVATYAEGVQLREAGIQRPIIVMSSTLEEELGRAREFRLMPVVYDFWELERAKELEVPFHVKLDTGMGRLGFLPSQWQELLCSLRGAKLAGVMTHFPSADEDPEFTAGQAKLFGEFVKALKGAFPKLWVHCDNSAALPLGLNGLFTHSRVGLALYGSKPFGGYPASLKQVMEVKARIISVKELPPGHSVSYGRTYTTSGKERVGVVSFGYADGLPRSLSGRGSFIVNGRRCPIRGRVCMDMTVISLEGVVAGKGGVATVTGLELPFEELARLAGTIPYELMCRISPRVERVYRGLQSLRT